ncbi:MAG TPA: hypothetical protein VMT25_01430 [Thermoanaerobaculia bacterium]|nr:hypothetical protein [Thermoanaerobaculia bacterium]
MLYPNLGVDAKPSSRVASWLARSLPPVLFTLLVLAVYADPLLTPRIFVGRDLVPYGLPIEKATHDALARGRLPAWNADVSGGRPLFSNPNAGPLYPLRPLLSRVPFPLAMRLFPVAHWVIAGLGAFFLLRALGRSGGAAWIAAATYAFSGVLVSEVFYLPLQAGAALLPWTLWATARPAATAWRKAAVLGLVYGLMMLGGDVFAVAIALLASALWILLASRPGARARDAAALGGGLVLAVLLAAPQIVATALLVPQTQRAVVPLRLKEILGYTLSPWRLLELVVPFPLGEVWTLDDHFVWSRGPIQFFYATLFCGGFAFVSLVGLPGRDRAARFCRVLFGVGALLAIAGSLVPAAWGLWRSPVPLRYPEKFSIAIELALALAAGLGFDVFRGAGRRMGWVLGVAVGLTAAAGAAALWPAAAGRIAVAAVRTFPAVVGEAGEQLPGALAEAGLLWTFTLVALALLGGSGRGRALAALAILTAVPIAANRRIAPAEHEAAVFPPSLFARAVARRDPAGAYRTIDEAAYRPASALQLEGNRASPWGTALTRRRWGYHAQSLWGRGTIFNVDVDRGDFSRLDSLRSVSLFAASQPDGAPFFSALSLRFGIRFRDQEPLPGFHRFGGDDLQDWDENPDARPDIRLLERWWEEPGAVAALGALPRMDAGEVVLETGRRASGTARPAELRILERSPERLAFDVSAPDPTWLFVLRGFWPYRTVRVDGVPVEGVPAQLAFSAVPVPAGRHRVDWVEEVPGFEVARWGPVLFAALALGLAAVRPSAIGPRA